MLDALGGASRLSSKLSDHSFEELGGACGKGDVSKPSGELAWDSNNSWSVVASQV